MSSNSPELVDYIFSHLVLPPKLPKSFDGDDVALISNLGRRLQDACATLRGLLPSDEIWETLHATLQAARNLHRGYLLKDDLITYFRQLCSTRGPDWLILHLDHQNAALLVYRHSIEEPKIIFEAFQVSPPSATVLEAEHALTRDFPDRAVSVPLIEMQNESLVNSLAIFLEGASSESFEQFSARAKKAGQSISEVRDPPRPVLITEMLLSLLEAVGTAENVPKTRKRARDDTVLDATDVPWRRSPYWLVVRVSVQRLLSTVSVDGDASGRVRYKFFLCFVLADLLGESVGKLHPEKTLTLQAKLCRRLAKLESERSSCLPDERIIYDALFKATSSSFEKVVADARRHVQLVWEDYKKTVVRHIPRLPKRASEADTRLRLLHSGDYLRNLLVSKTEPSHPSLVYGLPSLGDNMVAQVGSLADRYCALADYHRNNDSGPDSEGVLPHTRCITSSQKLLGYMEKAGDAFHGDPLLASRYLLKLFEYWVAMDQAATEKCTLLLQYHPMFVPEALDSLCLFTYDEMVRLSLVQQYLAARISKIKFEKAHIFSEPKSQFSFPKLFSELPEAGSLLRDHGDMILESSERSKVRKTRELEEITKRYEALTQSIQDRVCTCGRLPDGGRDIRGCTRCYKWRARKKLRISIHEDFLPSAEAHKYAVLFEITIPEYLEAYRAATWKLYLLGCQHVVKRGPDPALVLGEFNQLKQFRQEPQYDAPTLASEKKAFLQTHYQQLKIPKEPHEIILPFGPSFDYYDKQSRIWTRDLPSIPRYRYLMGNVFPRNLPDPYLNTDPPPGDEINRPTSYEIAAKGLVCPPEMSIHEVNAFQRLISSRGRRWLVILVELASSNINFSSEAAMRLLNHASLQAGPSNLEADVLREAHVILSDPEFCSKLHEQLLKRLEGLGSSWREVHCMSILVTLSLRAYYLAPSHCKPMLEELLIRIREITSSWIVHLRETVHSTNDIETAQKGASSALWAALLCRQTYTIYLDSPQTASRLGKEGLAHFLRASIALQQNLLTSLNELPEIPKAMLVRDLSMTHDMRHVIKQWLVSDYSGLNDAINETWTDSGASSSRTFSPWRFLEPPQSWWLVTEASGGQGTLPQVIHYHLLQGHLMIDGKPFGKLPLQMREDRYLKEIFEGQHLLTCPSNLPGMQYQLVNDLFGHQLHFGMRQGRVVIRVRLKGHIYEHVSREIFRGTSDTATSYDLPVDLVDDCVHWLNLDTGTLEMRRRPEIWKQRLSNWSLNVWNYTAIRNKGSIGRFGTPRTGSRLVELSSPVGTVIAKIFQGFEDVNRLTIYQPNRHLSELCVEMKRLEISFFVNKRNLLECRQLGAEIDPNQDIGALYGLASHLVLRNIHNFDKRSVLVPEGAFSHRRKGIHVVTNIVNDGMYARFFVDSVLGRLNIPPDPKLLYLKAALHAFTSFPLPDPLTQRTGTEEALQCLSSARSQPWTPLQEVPRRLLRVIQNLSPKRDFYPPGINAYQKVEWNENLTMTIQHEGFDPLVRKIMQQSQDLEVFSPAAAGSDETLLFEPVQIRPLSLRGLVRRLIYERSCLPSDKKILAIAQQTSLYWPKGAIQVSKESHRVYKVVNQLSEEPYDMVNIDKVARILKKGGNIGGFDAKPATLDIQSLLTDDVVLSLGAYIQACRSFEPSSEYYIAFVLSVLAFRSDTDHAIISLLIAVACHPGASAIAPPRQPLFARYAYNERPDKQCLEKLLSSDQPSHQAFFSLHFQRKARRKLVCSVSDYENAQMEEARKVVELLIFSWPLVPGSLDDFLESVQDLELRYMDLEKAWSSLSAELQRLTDNDNLSSYLREIKEIMSNQSVGSQWQTYHWKQRTFLQSNSSLHRHSMVRYFNPRLAEDLASKPYLQGRGGFRSIMPKSKKPQPGLQIAPSRPSAETTVLQEIAEKFIVSPHAIRHEYGKDLWRSIDALTRDRAAPKPQTQALTMNEIVVQIQFVRSGLHDQLSGLLTALSRGDSTYLWLNHGGLWPCVSPITVLELLRAENGPFLGNGMKKVLLEYAVTTTRLQQLLRMKDASLYRDDRRLQDEQRYEGHVNWDPTDYPDWILLEIDNDMLIRMNQIKVAEAIICPASGANSVLQMNMGQGKTSCILPMVVAILADKQKLCRLVVPKALLLQTAQIIQSRLGGLVGRLIRHIPFSRRSPSTDQQLDLFKSIHQETMQIGGVMISLPEHLLSFKMSGFQKLADGHGSTGKKMIKIQRWLDESYRDVLDESDFILSPKTQLIYPSGSALPVDGHPGRWYVIEGLLSLVETHTHSLQSNFAGGIEVIWRRQGFPIIHLLNPEVEDALNALLVDDICEGRLSKFQLKVDAPDPIKDRVRDIIEGLDVPLSAWEEVKPHLADDTFGYKILFLLRGLISHRIILLCLSKLWNVQYGLHQERAPMAVPFEAKGVPSATSEYGHPDTAIILTYLAFYQTGLTRLQMTQSLQHVLFSDDPATRWEHLVYGCDLPLSLRHWSLINIDDEAQMDELWSCLRFDRNMLNHYTGHFVFPRHAKQFGAKLQSSGWDIPLDNTFHPNALTTGFSGTNDNKRLLPGTIDQSDLPDLLKTNAEVLGYLLEERNNQCYKAADDSGRHLTETGLLGLLCTKGIRVLIDAGAYVLEMENHDLAAAWLTIDHNAQGAVYFDQNSRILVRARFQKRPIPLVSSPFADNLDKCVVYIDQRHTRGTDLKLPLNARGAVTLGLGQTKDHTVQAAMRLRQLSSTQSVAFVAPPEVYRSILALRPSKKRYPQASGPVNSVDVVRWLLEQSCLANESMIALRVAQGTDYCQRMNALHKHQHFLQEKSEASKLLGIIQQPEEHSLEELYGPKSQDPTSIPIQANVPRLVAYVTKLETHRRQIVQSSTALEEVEQEREFEFEVEQERETEKAPRYNALGFPGLDESILAFASSGRFDKDGPFIQAFAFLGSTKIGRRYAVAETGSNFFVSEQFTRTIRDDHSRTQQSVVRRVEWILWNPNTQIAVVVIPEEAELLIPTLRQLRSPQVWLLTYAAPVTKSMQVFNSLAFCTISSQHINQPFPDWLTIELAVFAGGLYFQYSHYQPLLAWLGVEEVGDSSSVSVKRKGVLEISSSERTYGLFAQQPLKFLLDWLIDRRQTQDVLDTPMGFISQGRALKSDHLFFTLGVGVANGRMNSFSAQGQTRSLSKDEHDDPDSDMDSDWVAEAIISREEDETE